MKLIDVDSLMEMARNHKDGKVDCNDIARFQTIDAVPVMHGRWIMRGGKRYCSACHQKACVTRDSDDFWYTVGTNYCHNCGAKMDRGDEDD